MKKTNSFIILIVVAFLSYVYGVKSYAKNLFPYPQFRNLKQSVLHPFVASESGKSKSKKAYNLYEVYEYSNIDSKKEVSSNMVKSDNLMVALAFGQSNIANTGDTLYTPKEKNSIFNFYKGKYYLASDPLLGPNGKGGNVCTRLADRLIQNNLFDKILLVPIAIGGTEIERWKPGGDLHPRILNVISQLRVEGFEITHMFWVQGETDGLLQTSQDAYKEMFLDMLNSIRKQEVNAPIYVAVASRSGNTINKTIQQAQRELVNIKEKIYPGPNLDDISDKDDRWDIWHFSDIGMNKYADAWLEVIKKHRY